MLTGRFPFYELWALRTKPVIDRQFTRKLLTLTRCINMVGPLAMLYIHRKTHENRAAIKECLAPYEKLGKDNGVNIVFTMFFGPNIYEANSLAPHTRPILISAEWGALEVRNDKECKNSLAADALCSTIGHEIAHKAGFPVTRTHGVKDITFMRWTHEVYCDYCSAKLIFDGDAIYAARVIDYKIKIKGRDMRDYPTHPSWGKRKKYLLCGAFDESMIDRLAKDTGCEDEDVIRYIKDYFAGRDIKLVNESVLHYE